MRFVAVKSGEDQQATLMAHKTRDLLIKQRTVERERLTHGHLAEFGVIAAKGINHVEELVERAAAADLRRWSRRRSGFCLRNCGLDAAIDELERARSSPTIDTRSGQPAGGERPRRRRARRFGDSGQHQIRRPSKPAAISPLGLAADARQNSTSGKEKLGSITKQGNRYIRRLLVLGAISLLRAAPKRKGALCDWLAALRARKPPKVVAVALANKLARIVWAIITTERALPQLHLRWA